MNIKPVLLLALLTLVGFVFISKSVRAHAPTPETSLIVLARNALSADSEQSARAIAALRAQGPAGLQALLNLYADELSGLSRADDPNWQRFRAALDKVCAQRDCLESRLYWYTDLDEAKAAARASGKPILSLRMLGRLDEELSCANSRFFRTALYPNAEIAQFLRDNFILHWHSVRPVPKVTIDFGDGRKIENTVTGNSIHYILDTNGRPIDALPGLYGPQAFLRVLQKARAAFSDYQQLNSQARTAFLRDYHSLQINEIKARWLADLKRIGYRGQLESLLSNSGQRRDGRPSAFDASRIAVTKRVVERPVVQTIFPDFSTLSAASDQSTWARLAQLHREDARLDSQSRALMQSKLHAAFADQLAIRIDGFERLIAEDTVRNEYLLRSQIKAWLMTDILASDLDYLNDRVYDELFLTPSSDPWLGLMRPEIYTAIDNDGIVMKPARP